MQQSHKGTLVAAKYSIIYNIYNKEANLSKESNMKKTIALTACLLASSFFSTTYADDTSVSAPNSPLVEWSSASSDDKIKIDNSSGANLSIQITVNGSDTSPGITVQNCGDTTTIQAGSTAICVTSDSDNPVTFASDNQSISASGTYQITQAPQLPAQPQQ